MLTRGLKFLRQNLVAMIALAVALSGTAYAAGKIGSGQIKPNAIRSFHLRNNQVKAHDLARGVRSKIYNGTNGGSTTNVVDPADQLKIVKVTSPSTYVFAETVEGAAAFCPSGYVVVGTGFFSGVASVGFLNNYGTYVGAGFIGSIIDSEVTVQATCALNSQGGATTSAARDTRRFKRDLARLRAVDG